jgi:adenylosuccinate lyase
LDRTALDAALADPGSFTGASFTGESFTGESFTGAAASQVDRVVAAVGDLVRDYPQAAQYTPSAIL